jgi:hypothetical protein
MSGILSQTLNDSGVAVSRFAEFKATALNHWIDMPQPFTQLVGPLVAADYSRREDDLLHLRIRVSHLLGLS